MDDQQFEMMMQMHRDTHDKIDNMADVIREVKVSFRGHVAEDAEVHKVVDRHTTYWKIATGGLTSVLTYFGIMK